MGIGKGGERGLLFCQLAAVIRHEMRGKEGGNDFVLVIKADVCGYPDLGPTGSSK